MLRHEVETMSEHRAVTTGLTRRSLLKTTVLGGGLFALQKLNWAYAQGAAPPAWVSRYSYTSWEDLYRAGWVFDHAGRTSHTVNCTGSCSWKVLVKNGIVWRDEQAADYPAIGPDLPDYNPRGCQKGACASDYQYGRQRVKYPLKRVGPRGSAKWQRISWDQALSEIADKLLDIIHERGPEYIFAFSPVPATSVVSQAAGYRLMNLLGGVGCSFYDWYCDLPPGEPMVWGVQTDTCESADWYNSRFIIAWGSNVNVTRIPDAQILQKARWRKGTKVVTISPEYSPTAARSDQFVPVRPGTDGALAAAMVNVMLQENLYDAPYVQEQTDLPFLVLKDSGLFLRDADLRPGGRADVFYVWDKTRGPVAAPKDSLALRGLEPVLEGNFSVTTTEGPRAITTVFSLLRAELAPKTPEWAAGVSGVPADVTRRLAREFAGAKPAMIILGMGVNHWYHNDLTNRLLILLAALTGNVGKSGGGLNAYAGQEKVWPAAGLRALTYSLPQRFQNTTMWAYWHGEMWRDDPLWPELKPYWDESLKSGWMPLWPKGGTDAPKAIFFWRANWISQAKGNLRILSTLLPKLDLIVALDFRMSSTGLYADYVLPAATWAEKYDLSMTDMHSFIHPFTPVVQPFAEARSDWQAFGALAQRIAERAAARGLSRYTDTIAGTTIERDFSTLGAQFTLGGKIAADRDAAQYILDNAPETNGYTMADLIRRPQRFKAASSQWTSEIEDGVAYAPFKRFVVGKQPWPTLTSRQQFYLDHPWFLKLGQTLPTYLPPLTVDNYPLWLNSMHARHAIHSTWWMNDRLQRLQRGEPLVLINPEDAHERGITDHDRVKVYNGYGWFVAWAKLYPPAPRGQLTAPHGMEMAQFPMRRNHQAVVIARVNPTQLVQYGHLRFAPNYWGPTGVERDVRVQVAKF